VRVAEVRRLIYLSTGNKQQRYKQLLTDIQQRVVELQRDFEETYLAVLRDLRRRHIYIVNEAQLDSGQARFIQDYFKAQVLPELEPILLDQAPRGETQTGCSSARRRRARIPTRIPATHAPRGPWRRVRAPARHP
jgi:polyphosphate kinase